MLLLCVAGELLPDRPSRRRRLRELLLNLVGCIGWALLLAVLWMIAGLCIGLALRVALAVM